MFLMVFQYSKFLLQITLLIVQFYLINMHLKIAKTGDGHHGRSRNVMATR
jgi:hypothetical protein